MAPERVLISCSNISSAILDTIPNTITIKDKEVPVDYINNRDWLLPGGARNQAMSACRTKFIMFFDGGNDYVHPQRIEFTYKAFQIKGVDLFYTNFFFSHIKFEMFKDLGDIYQITDFPRGHCQLISKEPITKGHVAINVDEVFWKRGLRFSEEMRMAEDCSFGIECLLKGCGLYATEKKLMVYKAHTLSENFEECKECSPIA